MFLQLVGLIILILYIYFKCFKYRFWSDLNVPFIPPTFPTGNVSDFLKSSIHFSVVIEKLYRKLKKSGDYAGIYFFGNPVFLVLTPEFAKTVLVKDFHYFMDRGIYFNDKVDPLSGNVFFLRGSKWKKLREKLTPTFTSAKMKQMFGTVLDVGQSLLEHLQPFGVHSEDIDIRDILARFMTDVISTCAFGLQTNSLRNPTSKFREMGKRMINFPKSKALKLIFASTFQRQATLLGIRWNDKEVSNFFMQIVKETIEYREASGDRRNDFMQLLIDMKKENATDKEEQEEDDDINALSLEEIAAQAFVFFFAGFETTSTTLTFALHLLAHNQDIQRNARESIRNVLIKHNGIWCYEAIIEMKYIEQIIEESLRMYPPVGDLHRWVSKDYTLPNGCVLPKETAVIIPNLAFSRDPDLFPDPMLFNPDRFTNAAKLSRHPFSTLPFGEGARICIGMRFGMMQTKLGLALLLDKFQFDVCAKTQNPIAIDNVNLFHGPAGKVWLNITNL
ncbi:unnamed protein product [Diamesa serratosioi]